MHPIQCCVLMARTHASTHDPRTHHARTHARERRVGKKRARPEKGEGEGGKRHKAAAAATCMQGGCKKKTTPHLGQSPKVEGKGDSPKHVAAECRVRFDPKIKNIWEFPHTNRNKKTQPDSNTATKIRTQDAEQKLSKTTWSAEKLVFSGKMAQAKKIKATN